MRRLFEYLKKGYCWGGCTLGPRSYIMAGQAGLRDTSHYIMPQSVLDKRVRTATDLAIQILNMLIQILKLAKRAKVPISRMPARILTRKSIN